jgi:hypothetical protein
MYSPLVFRPDLRQCVLEERLLPAIATFGVVILTTSGLTLLTPFPGANTSAAGSLGTSGSGGGSAGSVSGVAVPSSLYITGSNGISSLKPGNITGVPSLAGGLAGAGGVSVSFQIGSGSDTPGGTPTTLSSRNNIGDVGAIPTFNDLIRGPSATSGDADLPAGQTYRDTAPVPPPMPLGVLSPTGSSSSASSTYGAPNSAYSGPNPQLGAPSLGRFGTGRSPLMSPLPGSIGPAVPMPGNN